MISLCTLVPGRCTCRSWSKCLLVWHRPLTLNLAKCEFGKATVTYLGRQVGQGQVRPVEAKVTAVKDCAAPSTRSALRRFLGMAGYYRSFCRNFSTIAQPLTALTSPKVDFVWTKRFQLRKNSAKSRPCARCS